MAEALALLAQAEQWGAVRAFATSAWLYPFVSALHIVGLALLLGGIVPVDLRLLGCWRDALTPAAAARLRDLAAGGLALAVASGLPLFLVRGTEYLQNPWLLAKWGFVALGVANALLFARLARGAAAAAARRDAGPGPGAASWLDAPAARPAGALSLACWLSAVVCGRWIAFA